MKYRADREQLGELECITIRPADSSPVAALAVFCHGYGAGGDDLVGLAAEILSMASPARPVAMLFPAAGIDLTDQGMPGGRAWWNLSIQRLINAMDEGRYEQIRAEVPEGIDDACQKLTDVVRLALERTALDESRLMLGGFSQGAMLAVETACLGLDEPPAQLVLYSGALIAEQRWKPRVERLRGTQILQSHGRIDPILPLQTGLWLREVLEEAGCSVKFIDFYGPHTIPTEALECTAQMLSQLAE
jgi:phospholipase/carboxylesterase